MRPGGDIIALPIPIAWLQSSYAHVTFVYMQTTTEPLTYTRDEAAKVIGCHKNTVANLIDRGQLRTIPHLPHLLSREHVHAFIAGEQVAS